MVDYCPNISIEMIFMKPIKSVSSKTSEPHKFVLNLSQKLDLRSSNRHAAFQNLSIYYTRKNIRQDYNWNDKFELPGSSGPVSDI